MADEGTRLDAVGDWVSIPEAARLAGVSDKTMRRRVTRGLVESRMEENRYLIKAESVVPAAANRELIPVAFLDRLETLMKDLQTEAVARARAEVERDFQAQRAASEVERREQAEREVERLRSELDKASKNLEATDRIQTSSPRRWWQRPR